MSFLAISGGGSDGAFGAGLLVGWTARGDRPEFDIVTGVSTGALTAPFAFLGPRYDPTLKGVYTTYSTKQLVTKHPVRGLLGGDALASNAPLAGVIASYITPEFLQEVARQHARGRRLLIGTTNLDAQRPVIWDMGRIASSGDPRALELFRNVLLASAAIPGVFPPVYIEVNADGQLRQEMHVDGGTTNQVFLLPTQINAGGMDTKLGIHPVRRLYIVRNGLHVQTVRPRLPAWQGRQGLDEDAALTGQPVMTSSTPNPWKPLAIVLAGLLILVLIYAALVVSGVMTLGLSLLWAPGIPRPLCSN